MEAIADIISLSEAHRNDLHIESGRVILFCTVSVRLSKQAGTTHAFYCISPHSICNGILRSPDRSVQTHDPVPVQSK